MSGVSMFPLMHSLRVPNNCQSQPIKSRRHGWFPTLHQLSPISANFATSPDQSKASTKPHSRNKSMIILLMSRQIRISTSVIDCTLACYPSTSIEDDSSTTKHVNFPFYRFDCGVPTIVFCLADMDTRAVTQQQPAPLPPHSELPSIRH